MLMDGRALAEKVRAEVAKEVEELGSLVHTDYLLGTLAGVIEELTLALARRPQLLVLDEPVAMLDPIARHDFMATVLAASSADGVSVLLSSHVVSDLERVCDHVVVLVDSQVRVAGDVEELLATHHRLSGPRREPSTLPADQQVVWASHTDRQSTYVVRTRSPILDPAWSVSALGLEDLVLAYMEGPASVTPASTGLEALR